MKTPHLHAAIDFVENGQSYRNKNLKVQQAISVNKDNFDRHFTCFSNFEFVLRNLMVRTSGAKMMLMGDHFNYEIDTNCIVKFEQVETHEYHLLEKLSENVFKRSILKFDSDPR